MRGIPFLSQCGLNLRYKKRVLHKKYIPDLIVSDGIVVELKAVKGLLAEHEAQLINYLRATEKPVGYLINYGCAKELEWKRIIL
jgi:GxxExxY protein